MNLGEALGARRSCRDFVVDEVPAELLDTVLGAALRAPTAGNTWAFDLVVLRGQAETSAYWDVTLPAGPRRARFRWPGLLRAPVLVIPTVRPDAYVERYAEPDKARAALGDSSDGWPVPYWFVDGGAAIMAILLAATDAALGSLLFGQFDHGPAVAERFAIPDDRVALGTIALGWPHLGAAADRSGGRSARRGRPGVSAIVHRGGW